MTDDTGPPTDGSGPTDAGPAQAHRNRELEQAARLLASHAPPDWEQRFRRDELLHAVVDGQPIDMFVMAADIRGSTMLMKEAIRFERFALVMDKFVSAVRRGIQGSGGWFDKFLGDGFLAYWIMQPGSPDETERAFVQTAGNLVHTAHSLITLFHTRVLEDFRANSRNLSAGAGLSIGLDGGPGHVVKIADELTIVGPPVVGAVRMVTAASRPQEILTNVYLGRRLLEEQDGAYGELGMTVARQTRATKEYPRGQEIYALTFDDDDDHDSGSEGDSG